MPQGLRQCPNHMSLDTYHGLTSVKHSVSVIAKLQYSRTFISISNGGGSRIWSGAEQFYQTVKSNHKIIINLAQYLLRLTYLFNFNIQCLYGTPLQRADSGYRTQDLPLVWLCLDTVHLPPSLLLREAKWLVMVWCSQQCGHIPLLCTPVCGSGPQGPIPRYPARGRGGYFLVTVNNTQDIICHGTRGHLCKSVDNNDMGVCGLTWGLLSPSGHFCQT